MTHEEQEIRQQIRWERQTTAPVLLTMAPENGLLTNAHTSKGRPTALSLCPSGNPEQKGDPRFWSLVQELIRTPSFQDMKCVKMDVAVSSFCFRCQKGDDVRFCEKSLLVVYSLFLVHDLYIGLVLFAVTAPASRLQRLMTPKKQQLESICCHVVAGIVVTVTPDFGSNQADVSGYKNIGTEERERRLSVFRTKSQ